MIDTASTLLITKITVPRLSGTLVARPHLQAALSNGRSRKLILVTAAAGFGKTTLIADWIEHNEVGLTAWVSLDEADNDPVRFLSYLVAALQTQLPQIANELLTALQSPQPPPIQNVLISLVNQLTAVSPSLLLVLDDYHFIENDVIHTAVAFLLDHTPANITIALLSRSDPPLPIARYRAHQQLLEIRAETLRFSPAETAQFLNQAMKLDLNQAHIQALEQRTEGWIVGLQLAAIALQNSSADIDHFVREFSGSHRFILDYLLQEVLAQQPEQVQRFLLATAVLHRLNASLCSAVTGQDDGAAMLDYLEKHNLFLVPLDQSRQWYRYHHLFADLLQAHLQAAIWADVPALYRRAARWHETHHLPEEAVAYALAAQDFAYAAQLLLGPALDVLQRGEVTHLLQWYRAFPGGFVAQYPRLCVQFGLAFALNGRWPEAEALLQTLTQEAAIAPSETLLLAFLVASQRQDTNQLAAITAQATAQAQPDRFSQLVLGFILSFTGDLASACQQLAAVQTASERDGDEAMALTALLHQCRLQALRGNLQQAHSLSQQAIAQMQNGRHTHLSLASFAYVSLGRVYLEWNELDTAETQLQQTISLAERSGFVTGVLASATMMLADVAQARGDAAAAQQLAQQALDYARQYDPPTEVVWLEMYRVRLWLRAGDGATAVRWRQQNATPPPPTHINNKKHIPHTQTPREKAQKKPQ
jgi:LuxR family maltose regulon positive regulatory protein